MQAGGVAHLEHDVCRHGADALEHAAGQARLVARYHDNRHGLADGASNTEHDAGQHAGLSSRYHNREYGTLMPCAHGDGALVVAHRNRTQRRFGHADDGRQNHDAEQDGRRQNGRAGNILMEHVRHCTDRRYDDDHAEEAVYDGRNTSQQLGARLEQTVQLFRTVECHEYCGQQTDRHADNDRTGGDVQAAEDHRQDAVNVVARLPLCTGEEVQQANLLHGRHTVRKQENTDEHHREDGGQCTEEKYNVHQVFPKVFHKSFSYTGTGRIASPCFISL